MALIISTDYFEEILTEVGFPIITPNLLELTEDQIKKLLIWPAVREFFKWFPVQSENQTQVSSTFEVDFPNSTTFGIVDARLSISTSTGSGKTANPLINEGIINVSRRGYYGGRHNYEIANAYYAERLNRISEIEYQKIFRVKVDETNRVVRGYTNTYGVLSIIWADYSEDFSDIPFTHISDVIKLSRANILRYFGMLRNQATEDLPNEMTGDNFISRADELETEIIDGWKKHTKCVIIRS